VDTAKYGGKKLSKKITLHTNDPQRKTFQLTISGEVKMFAKTDRKVVHLWGPASRKVEHSITIVPLKKYPFKITELYAEDGKNIRFSLKQEKDQYVLTVENALKTKGKYFDKIHLKTDSQAKPEIIIEVSGMIG